MIEIKDNQRQADTRCEGTDASGDRMQPCGGVRERAARLPAWMKRPCAYTGKKKIVEDRIASAGLHTVCVEAKCPNRGECHANGTATFLILGTICSRGCGFCNIKNGLPEPVDLGEPARVGEVARIMGLRHVVVTSVTRDDVADGGASVFVQTIHSLRQRIPGCTVEVLAPDFNGNGAALASVMGGKPEVFGHNIETVPRLYPEVRRGASYQRSLEVLSKASACGMPSQIKSGLMVGLGERCEEVVETMKDLVRAGCSVLTIGQYLQPSPAQVPVYEFIAPHVFKRYEAVGLSLGFSHVFAGPYVRSSYRSSELAKGKKR